MRGAIQTATAAWLLILTLSLAGTVEYSYDELGRLAEASWQCPSGTIERTYVMAPDGEIIRLNALEDRDGDSLPDAWEVAMFGGLTISDGAGDYDDDGMSDYAEWLAGMDPTSDESTLSHNGLSATTTSVTIAWASASNRTYKVEHTTNLLDGFTATLATGIEGAPGTNAWTHSTTNPVNFYRVTQEDE